jgi:hypothetical protein
LTAQGPLRRHPQLLRRLGRAPAVTEPHRTRIPSTEGDSDTANAGTNDDASALRGKRPALKRSRREGGGLGAASSRRAHPRRFDARLQPLREASPASVGVGTLDIHDEWAHSDEGQDDLLRLVARVDIPVNQSRRNMEEPAGLHVRALAPARSELEARASADHMAKYVSLAVVVPAGRDAALRACTYEDRTREVERDLTDEAGRRRSRREAVCAQGSDLRMSALHGDAARLQLTAKVTHGSTSIVAASRRPRVLRRRSSARDRNPASEPRAAQSYAK